MPKLWETTIEAHRREVRDAILETTWQLVSEHGLLSVTMSQVAEATGIGRATLYKYFPDVEAILQTRHQQHVAAHLAQLADLRHRNRDAHQRLEAVLQAYARICYHRERHGTEELAGLLHRGEQIAAAEQQLLDFFRDLLQDVAATGEVRTDVRPDELAKYCIHALAAAASLPSEAAARRLADVTLSGLRPPRATTRLPRAPRPARP